jgi:hypothetical protein
MKRNFLLSSLFFLILFSLVVRPAHAVTNAPAPFANPTTPYAVYLDPAPGGVTNPLSLPSSGNVYPMAPQVCNDCVITPTGTGVSAGGVTAAPAASGGGVEINGVKQYSINGPSSGTPSAPFAGDAPTTASVNVKTSVPAAAASGMAKEAVFVGGAAAVAVGAARFIPYVGVALMAAQVGMAGYDLYQGIHQNGITINPDGSASYNDPRGPIQNYYMPSNPCPVSDIGALASCMQTAYNSGRTDGVTATFSCSPSMCTYHPVSSGWDGGVRDIGAPSPFGVPVAPPPTVATDAQIIAAFNAAMLSMTAAADAVNYAMSQAVPIPVGLPVTNTPSVVSISSAPNLASQNTDATGNTTKNFTQNKAQVSPSTSSGGAPTVTPSVTNTTTVNNNTTNTTNTFPAPFTPSSPVSLPSLPQLPVSDLCVQHPDILACSNDASLHDLPDVASAVREVNVGTIFPVANGAAGICPAPVVVYTGRGSVSLDIWSPLCSFANLIRSVNIAAGALAGIYIVIGALRNV